MKKTSVDINSYTKDQMDEIIKDFQIKHLRLKLEEPDVTIETKALIINKLNEIQGKNEEVN